MCSCHDSDGNIIGLVYVPRLGSNDPIFVLKWRSDIKVHGIFVVEVSKNTAKNAGHFACHYEIYEKLGKDEPIALTPPPPLTPHRTPLISITGS